MNSKLVEYSPQAIANIQTVEEATDLYEKLKALESYTKENFDQAFSFAVARLECLCRIGELIEDGQERGEIASRSNPMPNINNVLSQDIVTLDQLGISRNLSSESKKAKSVPSTKRQEYYDKILEKEALPDKSTLLKLANGNLSQPMQVLLSHEEVEYYTPSHVIEAARSVMGRIDLDPASCEAAQKLVKAKEFYTKEDDGLSKQWHGNVWLNPPYSKTGGRSNQELWAQYLIQQYKLKAVEQASLLVKSTLGYKWFEELWDHWPVCFLRERLSFIKQDGTDSGSSKYGTAIFYFGENSDKFIEVFSSFGRITIGDRYIVS